MSKRYLLTLLVLSLLILMPSACGLGASARVSATSDTPTPAATDATTPTSGGEVRPPAVAGQFYPDNPDELLTLVDTLLQNAARTRGEPIALIVPHAGYVFSGAVAARAFKQLEDLAYDAVVVIGTNHTDPTFNKVSVYAEGSFSTPLGSVPVDTATAKALLAASPTLVFDRNVHRGEHSIEVELPFLQRIYRQGLTFVPAIVGEPTLDNVRALSDALTKVLSGKKVLIVASSDMSHYPPYDQANRVDHRTLAAIETLDPDKVLQADKESMSAGVPELAVTLCGQGPVLAAMMAAQNLGANRATTLMYANSGDTAFGDHDRVVGYGAVMLWHDSETATPAAEGAPTSTPKPATGQLTTEQKTWLLNLARTTLESFVKTQVVAPTTVDDPELLRPAGAFVTLKENGELRGCIGHMAEDTPLYLTVQKMALAAGLQDTRFNPVGADELPKLEYEISVLSPMQPIDSVDQIQLGVHGVILQKDGRQAVFLPQVAPEQGWTRDEMLSRLSEKAGLPADAWRQGARFLVFTADVFK